MTERDVGLFETGVQEPGDPRPYWRPLRCRLCGKRFARWNGTANHGFMHHNRGDGVRVELKGRTPGLSVYAFFVKGTA